MKFLAYVLTALILGGNGVTTSGMDGAEKAIVQQSISAPAQMETATIQPKSQVMTANTGSQASKFNAGSNTQDGSKTTLGNTTDTNAVKMPVVAESTTQSQSIPATTQTVTSTTSVTTVQQPTVQYSSQGSTGSQVAEQSDTSESDQQKAQDMANQEMQKILQQQGLTGASGQTFTGPNSDQQAQAWVQQQQQQDAATFQHATSQSAQVAQGSEDIKQFLSNVVGIPASQLPSDPTGGDTTITDGLITAINGKPVTCTYSKTISGPGYSITYMVFGGQALELKKVGNVPTKLIPPGCE